MRHCSEHCSGTVAKTLQRVLQQYRNFAINTSQTQHNEHTITPFRTQFFKLFLLSRLEETSSFSLQTSFSFWFLESNKGASLVQVSYLVNFLTFCYSIKWSADPSYIHLILVFTFCLYILLMRLFKFVITIFTYYDVAIQI